MISLTRRHLWKAVAFVFCFLILNLLFFRHTSAPQAVLPFDRPPAADVAIPRRIWQIFFAPSNARLIDKSSIYSSQWISMAPGYTYTMVSEVEATSFIDESFKSRPEAAATYHALKNPALKSDFLRYLLLLKKGGIYSDLDTKPVVPLEEWIPADKRRKVHLLIAPEYDESKDPHYDDFMHSVQFCQWTIAAAPGHPILARMVDRVIASLNWVAHEQGTTLDKAAITDFHVLNSTGPMAWTETVMEWLQEKEPSIKDYSDFFGISAPRYYQDVALFPLETFRADGYDDWGIHWRKDHKGLVRHYFKGAWRQIPLD